jgi:hypothetical protein
VAFLSQLRAIMFRVAIPSWYAPEAGIVVLHSTFLVLRTLLSILVARLDGRLVRDIVKADGKGFLKGLGLWFLLAIPSTLTNSMVNNLQLVLITLQLICGTLTDPTSPIPSRASPAHATDAVPTRPLSVVQP